MRYKKVIDSEFMVCSDCFQIIAYGDATALDYHYSESEAEKRLQEIESGLANTGGIVFTGDSSRDDEFSTSACECCRSLLHGSRHHCVILEKVGS